ncbi:2-oxoacid:acceptor oxidoreductase subunit alpha [Calorimonas adulescens]|uniref:2-oxoacid:acceptor oxidoreductase subunit alpha n=1 Tax=Calorimonas adulescens TaxID=2606906 RepID=A0A5D8QEI7_9THEO|nr:2-oxoacid:acceptor oxidoreductase subunit alpha [Calorimonas adulescens]TZE83130.1 2-oxoacid:acceptor oxidoreductase subunit alpha [Calorimonas adulescens]
MEYNILIGGEAGQGMDTIGNLLEKTLKRCGFYVFTYKDYMSRIRGGHNFNQVRFSDKPLYTHSPDLDIIFALNEETINLHNSRLKQDGIIICDNDIAKVKEVMHLPLVETSKKVQDMRVYTTAGLGAILKIFGLPLDIAEGVIRDEFSGKIAETNIQAVRAGYEMIGVRHKLETREDKNIIINGNQAVAMGAIAAGCKFYCGYPMTPSSGVLTFMASKSDEMGIMVQQVEDEVAALNMALGASYAGVRAMTGSSGGGFALMVEALSLAGMIETPVVVIDVQRPAPATGFPTRTEQADLRFLIHAGHGEFPRMVIALRDPEDAFYQTARAFNIAEKYQIPVLLMSDEYLSDYTVTIKPYDFGKVKIERYISGPEAVEGEEYKRFKITESGVSPRILPGKVEGQVVLVDSDEHDEWGHITESAEMRVAMVDKRMRKLEGLRQEIEEPWFIGKENPENLIVCWGSTYGAVREAVERLNGEGVSIGALVYGDIWPLPTKRLMELYPKVQKLIDIEQNATGQLDSLIKEKALIRCSHKILKYDGRAFSGVEIYNRLKEEVL